MANIVFPTDTTAVTPVLGDFLLISDISDWENLHDVTIQDVVNLVPSWLGITASVTELNYTDWVTSAIQTQLDWKVDENWAITGATKTKVTYDAKWLVTAWADATTADIADSSNKRYVTDANLTVIGNTSGTNTGDQTTIVWITGTKTEFDTACSDWNFLYTGDIVWWDATNNIGYLNIPQNSQSAAYTTVLADSGKSIDHPSTDANARTFTIDSNANVAYPIGTAISFSNMTSQVVTIAITSDTMYLAGAGTTGSRSLAQYGTATARKLTTTTRLISWVWLT